MEKSFGNEQRITDLRKATVFCTKTDWKRIGSTTIEPEAKNRLPKSKTAEPKRKKKTAIAEKLKK